MKLSQPRIAIVLMAACIQMPIAAAGQGTGTWRCGNTYTDQPCNGGKALDLADARSGDQKRQADGTIREARSAADRLERDRVRLEQAEGRRKPTLIDNAPRTPRAGSVALAETSVSRRKKAKNNADHFKAYDPVATDKARLAKSARKGGAKR